MKVTPDFQLTPEIATDLLEMNPRNRRVKAGLVNLLANAITEGRFRPNGDAIRIGRDGTLYDGQHRCRAVVKSGIPISVILVEDLDPEVIPTIDQGVARTAPDIVRMTTNITKNTTAEAALAKALLVLSGEVTYADASRELVAQYVADHFDELYDPARIGANASKQLRKTGAKDTSSVALGIAVTRLIEAGNDASAVEEWLSAVCMNDGLHRGTPDHALSVYLHNGNLSRSGRVPVAKVIREVAPILKAWNYRVEGKPMKILRADDVTELPAIKVAP